ncbi:MAG TPA: hypothetical protein VK097_10325 [Lentibacillus sp.]|nr:hypothetical protein [Lentibacillus sp.]HLR62824.1 hypothetical protein [Lentibacillus sp.]
MMNEGYAHVLRGGQMDSQSRNSSASSIIENVRNKAAMAKMKPVS